MRREERDAVLHKGHTGTLRWMAPEVLGAVSQYTEKVRARRGAAAAGWGSPPWRSRAVKSRFGGRRSVKEGSPP